MKNIRIIIDNEFVHFKAEYRVQYYLTAKLKINKLQTCFDVGSLQLNKILKRNLMPKMNTCPTVRHGIVCGGKLKEYKKKSGKKHNGVFTKTTTYLRCQKSKCQTYHSLKKILSNNISNAILPSSEDQSQQIIKREENPLNSTDINDGHQDFESSLSAEFSNLEMNHLNRIKVDQAENHNVKILEDFCINSQLRSSNSELSVQNPNLNKSKKKKLNKSKENSSLKICQNPKRKISFESENKIKKNNNIRSYNKTGKISLGLNASNNVPRQKSHLKVSFSIPTICKDQSTNDKVLYNSTTGRFLQNCICLHLSSEIEQCIECTITLMKSNLTQYDYDNVQCRFYAFRELELKSEQLTIAGYPDPFKNASILDLDLWKPDQHSFIPSDLKIRASIKILEDAGGQLCKVIQDEKEALKLNLSGTQNSKTPIWKKPVKGVRELCDVCKTTIFNYHWSCLICGFVVCVDCIRNKLGDKKSTTQHVVFKQDNPVWLVCSNRKEHQLDQLTLTQILAGDSLNYISTLMHNVCIKYEIPLKCKCSCCIPKIALPVINCSQFETEIPENMIQDIFPEDSDCKDNFFPYYEDNANKNFDGIEYNYKKESLPKLTKMIDTNYDSPPHMWLCNGLLLNLLDPDTDANYELFQEQWIRGQPVLVSGVGKGLNKSLWNPESFSRDFGDQINDLIDCSTNKVIHDQPMSKFWDGFEDGSKRLRDKDGRSMMLKLKDWPQSEDFAERLPDRFKNLMDCLPLKEYTHRNGKFNLASYLPECFVRPDLGPKMYIAYGNAGTTHKLLGTTNLHLDMSDAINVMVYVAITKNCSENNFEWYVKEAINVIEEDECDVLSKKRVYVNGEIPGAVWHIYHAQDADYIRDLLHKIDIEQGVLMEECSDPIHDQSHYLDKYHRDRLYREYGIRGYTIIQCAGDAVFIPAGAPHQVRNLHNCIKVAEDFVSPENIHQSFRMTQEFRNLTDYHTNHEDKLQLKNIAFHAVKDSISVLMHTKT
ncbi:JmjC domain [Cinara cedri]|uniref:[histone H3]-dimethyl-L-lysine(9) demethylase n=1 Tax=Cinara cedri TaxID=506608 RepID=A0A5E4MMH1_9HEMI|nr:JmjC domain [Cinara cedri]